jgi:hypothetical protein
MGVVDDLLQARAAYDRRDWLAAYGGLSDAGADQLTAEDFSRLATAAYLVGRRNDCVQALQRAYQMHLDTGAVLPAVRIAFWLALVLLTSGETAVGGGWVGRAQRLLADVDDDVVERGYVLIHVMYRHIFADDFGTALELATQVTDYGRRFADPDLLAMGLCSQGRILLYCGRVPDGLALLDEAMVGVAAGEVSTIFAGNVYCTMIEGCQEIADFDRAARWTSALTSWCEQQPDLVPFTGQCAVHRGQIMRAHGAFDEALTEFDLAMRRYRDADALPAAGLAMAERGDVLRLRGDLAGAAAAYDAAVTFGYEPQPGLALLWLAQGRTSGCSARPATRCTAPGCCRPPWRSCSPATSRTAPPATPRSSGRSPRRSVARRCRRAPTTPGPRWHSAPVTRRRHSSCCAASVACGSGWARGTTPHAPASCLDGRCGRLVTRTPLSRSCTQPGARSRSWVPGRRNRRPPRLSGPRCRAGSPAARWRFCDWSPPDEPTRRSRLCWCSARRR